MKTNGVAGALSVREDDEIMMFTHAGQAVRSPVKDVRVIGRTTQGVRLINLVDGDSLIGICRIVDIRDDNAAADNGDSASQAEAPDEQGA